MTWLPEGDAMARCLPCVLQAYSSAFTVQRPAPPLNAVQSTSWSVCQQKTILGCMGYGFLSRSVPVELPSTAAAGAVRMVLSGHSYFGTWIRRRSYWHCLEPFRAHLSSTIEPSVPRWRAAISMLDARSVGATQLCLRSPCCRWCTAPSRADGALHHLGQGEQKHNC
eukprot:272137-Chlamydomonas_euryale.AAC.2